MKNTEKIALFPLGLVMLPGMILPLHIFEERYKEMINDCIDNNTKFGIVYYSGEDFKQTGCIAEITKVIKKHENGRMDIITEGKERFRVIETYDDKSYLQADVEYFDDEYETEGLALEDAKEEGIRLLNELMRFYSDRFDLSAVRSLDTKTMSFLFASNGGFTMNEKQFFLDTINTRERIEKVVKSLKIIIDRLKVSKDIGKIIQSNGYLPKKHD